MENYLIAQLEKEIEDTIFYIEKYDSNEADMVIYHWGRASSIYDVLCKMEVLPHGMHDRFEEFNEKCVECVQSYLGTKE